MSKSELKSELTKFFESLYDTEANQSRINIIDRCFLKASSLSVYLAQPSSGGQLGKQQNASLTLEELIRCMEEMSQSRDDLEKIRDHLDDDYIKEICSKTVSDGYTKLCGLIEKMEVFMKDFNDSLEYFLLRISKNLVEVVIYKDVRDVHIIHGFVIESIDHMIKNLKEVHQEVDKKIDELYELYDCDTDQ